MEKQRLILIDGHALAYRTYFALEKQGFRTRETHIPTWAVYGFTRILLETISKYKPQMLAVSFDRQLPTFRHEGSIEYKANRKPMPDDLQKQIPLIKEVIQGFDIPIYEFDGYEADDVIGTLAKQAEEKDYEVLILTSDQDMMQLVSDNISVLRPKTGTGEVEKYDKEKVLSYYNLRPDQIVDFKALRGDPSDNIVGVPGIGEKTAIKLLNEFDNLENLLNNLDKVKNDKLREKLRQNIDKARESYFLAKIYTDVDINFDCIECSLFKPDTDKLIPVLKKLEFSSILNDLPKIFENFISNEKDNFVSKNQVLDLNVKIITDFETLENLINDLNNCTQFAIDTETTGINSLNVDLVGISISYINPYDSSLLNKETSKIQNFSTYYIPLAHKINDGTKQLPIKETLERLKPILENEKILKVGQNIKYEMNIFSCYGIKLRGIGDDTIIMDYLLNPDSKHGLKEIAFSHLGYNMTLITDLIGKGVKSITIDQVPISTVAQYAGADAAVTLELSFFLKPKLEQMGLIDLYKNIELPLIEVLSTIEQNGVKIDTENLSKFSQHLAKELSVLESRIYEIAGKEFNINSPQQMSEILFNKLGISTKGIKKTQLGFSTDARVLEKLKDKHIIIPEILNYRQLMKLKTTYADSLPNLINPKTGKIHTSFNQTITGTGRLSSSDPNLQNIPIRTEIGKQIRRSFIPSKEGYFILSADYSQIELRILAHLSKDPVFIEAFCKGQDIHSRTAMDIFYLPSIESVTEELRRIAKTVNFGIIYGQTPFGLAKTLNISNNQATKIITDFKNKYPNVQKYIDNTVDFAKKNGYVSTIFKRIRYIPDINHSDKIKREFATRVAINAPIQGSAADIIKIAMILLHDKIIKEGLDSKMILQVHDELVFEVPENEISLLKSIIIDIMENVCNLKVPLKVDIKIGTNWAEAK